MKTKWFSKNFAELMDGKKSVPALYRPVALARLSSLIWSYSGQRLSMNLGLSRPISTVHLVSSPIRRFLIHVSVSFSPRSGFYSFPHASYLRVVFFREYCLAIIVLGSIGSWWAGRALLRDRHAYIPSERYGAK